MIVVNKIRLRAIAHTLEKLLKSFLHHLNWLQKKSWRASQQNAGSTDEAAAPVRRK